MAQVSVIVPMHNVQDYVGECVQSLRTQTFGDFEVLCIDDASQDATLERAQAAAEGDERFCFFPLKENVGLSRARNFGLDYAQGTYVVFLDADDMLDARALDKLVARANEQELDDLFFTAESFYESEAARSAHAEDMPRRSDCPSAMPGRELFAWFVADGMFWPQAPYHMVRRSFLVDADIRFYPGILHEDELYSALTVCSASRAGYLNEPLYRRRVREGSIMTSARGMDNIVGVFRVVVELRTWLHAHGDECTPEFIDAFAQNLNRLYRAMVEDASSVSAEDLSEFALTLPPDERLEFYLTVRDGAFNRGTYQQEILDSATYRLGDTLLRVPRAIRDAFK